MNPQFYALLDSESGWLVNTVVWDGDESKWTPPAGTNAVPMSEVDVSALPAKPEQEEPIP